MWCVYMIKKKYYITKEDSIKIRIELLKRKIRHAKELSKMFHTSDYYFTIIIGGSNSCTKYFFECMNKLGIDVKKLCKLERR